MPGVTHCDGQTKASPTKKNRASVRFFQKKEAKRSLEFETIQPDEQPVEEKEIETCCDQVVPAAPVSPPVCSVKNDSLVPFVGFNNLGNTCYLNSILQVLCYCPGFRPVMKQLCEMICNKREKKANAQAAENNEQEVSRDDLAASYNLICNLSALIHSTELLQVSYLLSPESYATELATQPKRLLSALRELNPMYDGYLQHDAQEVLQCILVNVQEACQNLKKEIAELQATIEDAKKEHDGCNAEAPVPSEGPKSEKRKSDNEVGNVNKKTRLSKETAPEEQRVTRSKRKSLEKQDEKADPSKISTEPAPTNRTQKKKSKLGLKWLKSSKQPSILSKFRSLGKTDNSSKISPIEKQTPDQSQREEPVKENGKCAVDKRVSETLQNEQSQCELVEKLFQGQLVLRTRCLECEGITERRENFQDVSVPVQENSPPKPENSSDLSPDPRPEVKTLKWAISQFASVEKLVGDDKYFCEKCNHYTEAERSLLFDKIPDVVTVHLKCFSANILESDGSWGLSKVNTPLLTPLHLSLEEWSTKPSKNTYSLFAVVMHNGVTISSGHYTALVKMSDLNHQIDWLKAPGEHQEVVKTEPLTEEEARASDENHDDAATFRPEATLPASGKVAKKNMDAVGLLGGQKSKSDFEQLPAPKAEKVPEDKGLAETNGDVWSDHDQKCQTADDVADKSVLYLQKSLSEYEGKWLLFDDSEVKVMDEGEFLSAISPGTESTSTPYLLFYKKMK